MNTQGGKWESSFTVEPEHFLGYYRSGARFSTAPETFRARKAIFSSSVAKSVYAWNIVSIEPLSILEYVNKTAL